MSKSKDDRFPSLGIALYYLRKTASVSREDFGRPFGLSSKTISEYESGHRRLSPARAEQLIEPHGFGPRDLDEILSDIETRRGVISPEGTIPLPPEELQILAREQRELSAFMGSELGRLRRRARARADHITAGELFEHLATCTPEERRLFVTRAEKYRLWALSVRFGEESTKAAPDSASRAVEYAMLSLRIANLAPASPRFRVLLRGQAWAFLANARRVSGYLPRADKGFARSARLCQEGEGGDPDHLLDHSRRLDLEASLRLQQNRLEEALSLLDRALAAGAMGGAAGRLLLIKAFAFEQCGKPEAALKMLERVEGHLGTDTDKRLVWVLRLNQAVCFCHLNRFEEAANLVPVVRALAIELRNELDLVRVLWMEARTFAGLGRVEEAISSLSQVRRNLVAEGISFDAALAALELAALHLDQGNPHAARELAAEVEPLLRVQQVPRDLIASLFLFVQALEQETATAATARKLLRVFEHRGPIDSTSWAKEHR
ncbi:MAG: helix-turn-helix domain-containing protein [Acidobacteriota bacterium]